MLYSGTSSTPAGTYFNTPKQLHYFGVLCEDSKSYRFEIVIEPDLSDVFLHVKDTFQFPSNDYDSGLIVEASRIFEDIVFSC